MCNINNFYTMSDYEFDDDFIDDEDDNPFVLKSSEDENDDSDDWGTEIDEKPKQESDHDDFGDSDDNKDEKEEKSEHEEPPLPEEKIEEHEEEQEQPPRISSPISSSRDEVEPPRAASPISSNASSAFDDDDEDVKEVMETQELFQRSQKFSTLHQSLSLRLTETNQLFSLLMCVMSDTEMLINRNRSALDFSIPTECQFSGMPLTCDNGRIIHNKFTEGYNLTGCSDEDATNVVKYIDFSRKLIERGLPMITDSARAILQDPLVKMHRKLNSQEQRINDLKRANQELSLQTRHTANRLVQLEKEGQKEFKGETSNSDVIIQQQRLQKALIRISQLKEGNEQTQSQNAKLAQEVPAGQPTQRSTSKQLSSKYLSLMKALDEIKANVEQSEEERETAMAQRRVSISRMNKGIEKLEAEIAVLKTRMTSVDNKLRVMSQGKSSHSGSRLQKAPGSKIPVPSKKPK